MSLAHIDSHIRHVVASCDMLGLKAEGTDLPRRTYPLPRVAKNSFSRASDHSADPTLAYKFSILKPSASAISRIADASAKTSSSAMRTPRHLASNSAARSFPRSSLSFILIYDSAHADSK